jgi:hypothetical protein
VVKYEIEATVRLKRFDDLGPLFQVSCVKVIIDILLIRIRNAGSTIQTRIGTPWLI